MSEFLDEIAAIKTEDEQLKTFVGWVKQIK